MNLGVSSYICSAGLRAVTSGGALGPYFALKYCIPFYDYRLDKTICRETSGTTSAVSISSLNYVSATHSSLVGEKIYANGNYTLTNNNKFLFWKSSMGSLPDGVTNTGVLSQQSVSTDVNLESNKPISTVVSGATVTPNLPGNFTITSTKTISGIGLSTFNPLTVTAWPLSAFFPIVSYSPNVNGVTSATGTYQCHLPASNSSYKFNGLAVYATKVDNNGFDDSGNGISFFNFNPTLFAVILFDQAQYKQPTPGGINDFEISIDLSFDWNTVNPGVSAQPVYINTNYWNKLPISTTTSANGLSYDGDIVISSSAVPGSWTPRAKLTVTDNGKQQLRLANDNIRFTDFQTIRFPIEPGMSSPNFDDRAVLSIDTSCPEDSLMQLGYKTSALGIKSLAIGCYASATGYFNGTNYANTYFGDSTQVPTNGSDVRGNSGGYTVSIGVGTLSQGFGSWSIGYNTSSIGYLNFAGGDNSIASYNYYNPGATFSDNSPQNGLNFAYGKYTSAISRASDNQYCDYVNYIDSEDNESYGSNLSFGVRNLANGGLSLAFGNSVSSFGMGSVGFGYSNLSNGCFSFVGGVNSVADNAMSFAYGYRVSALSNFGIAFGKDNIVNGYDPVSGKLAFGLAIGDSVSSTKSHSIGIGQGVLSDGIYSIALGSGEGYINGTSDFVSTNPLYAASQNSVAIGYATSAIGKWSTSIGTKNSSIGDYSLALVYKSSATKDYSVSIGYLSLASGDGSLAANWNTVSNGWASTSFGNSTSASGYFSLAGGYFSYAGGVAALAFGRYSYAGGNDSIALGNGANTVNYSNSIAIGAGATVESDNQVTVGSCLTNTYIRGNNIVIGDGCSTNVTFNGISQLNDSISIDYKILAWPDTNSPQNPRKISITINRNGLIRSVGMIETAYQSSMFNIGTDALDLVGDAYFYSNVQKKMYKLQQNSSVDLFHAFSVNNYKVSDITANNIWLYYDSVNNCFVIYGYDITNGLATSYTYNNGIFDNSYIFVGKINSTFKETDTYTYFWKKNVNIINVYSNYDKSYVIPFHIINTNPTDGNGFCAYNIFNRTIGGTKFWVESIICKIDGLTNFANPWAGYSSNNEYANSSEILVNQFTGGNLVQKSPFAYLLNPGGGNDREVSQAMSGMFINSNGYSIGTNPIKA